MDCSSIISAHQIIYVEYFGKKSDKNENFLEKIKFFPEINIFIGEGSRGGIIYMDGKVLRSTIILLQGVMCCLSWIARNRVWQQHVIFRPPLKITNFMDTEGGPQIKGYIFETYSTSATSQKKNYSISAGVCKVQLSQEKYCFYSIDKS